MVDFRYDARNRLDQVLDPEGRAVTFGYDDANRVTSTMLPDQQTVGFGFDAASNITSVTPPGRPAHTFTYTPSNRLQSYQLPDVGNGPASETRTYDADLRLTSVTRPDGKVVGFEYDPQKYRLARITSPRGNTDFGYDGKTGQLTSIEEPDGQGLAFEYDGPLVKKTTWSGEVSGTVERAYDEDLRLSELRVNGADPIVYRYDDDGQLIQVGDMTITRDPVTGRELTTTLGQVTTERTYTPFGEPATYTAKFAGNEIYFESYTYNKLGWITNLERRVHTVSTLYRYEYDARGRLSEVWENGVLTSSYTYDANSNRLTYTGPLGDAVGVYDARDRLIAYGGATYTYTEAGELATKTENGLTTTYDYDVFGNLRKVELPNGIVVEYVIDGAQRRVGEKIDGVLVRQWLWDDLLQPVAELDGRGFTGSSFVYLSRPNSPDAIKKGARWFRVVTDFLGSPRLVVNSLTGEVVHELRYSEFGSILFNSAPDFQPFGFAGGLTDSHTAFYRFRARDLAPSIGRFTTIDPSGFGAGDPNLYSYAFANPVAFFDPTGNTACDNLVNLLVNLTKNYPSFISRKPLGASLVTLGNSMRKNSTKLPSDGFRPSLVADGQGADVLAHATAHAGTVLLGLVGNLIHANANDSDVAQLEDTDGATLRKQSISELAGNKAGRVIGSLLDDMIGGAISPNDTRHRIHDFLCEDGEQCDL